ncbi:MAG: hypothetical protein L0177_11310, partial [Chloroflexi bacterium]|nr:hypothetical protein [Chloroflexota bacterium]
VAVEVQVLQDAVLDPATGRLVGVLSTGDLWLMAGINWGLTIVSVVGIANVLGQKRYARRTPVPSPLANMSAGRVEAD